MSKYIIKKINIIALIIVLFVSQCVLIYVISKPLINIWLFGWTHFPMMFHLSLIGVKELFEPYHWYEPFLLLMISWKLYAFMYYSEIKVPAESVGLDLIVHESSSVVFRTTKNILKILYSLSGILVMSLMSVSLLAHLINTISGNSKIIVMGPYFINETKLICIFVILIALGISIKEDVSMMERKDVEVNGNDILSRISKGSSDSLLIVLFTAIMVGPFIGLVLYVFIASNDYRPDSLFTFLSIVSVTLGLVIYATAVIGILISVLLVRLGVVKKVTEQNEIGERTMKYIRKNNEVRAIQWTGMNIEEVIDFLPCGRECMTDDPESFVQKPFNIETQDGDKLVEVSDFIIIEDNEDITVMSEQKFKTQFILSQ